MTPGITIATPTIPPRAGMLAQLIASVGAQTLPPAGMAIALDSRREGAARTRQRALDMVTTEFVAFADDDDWLYPNHLAVLSALAEEHGADYCYSWFDGNNPFPTNRGLQMDPEHPHHTTMTVLVRTELAKAVGFATDHPDGWAVPQEDWRFTLGCIAAGAKFAGTGEVTWHYSIHNGNTSGLPTRW